MSGYAAMVYDDRKTLLEHFSVQQHGDGTKNTAEAIYSHPTINKNECNARCKIEIQNKLVNEIIFGRKSNG
jgi:hypothetical protein